MVHSLNSILVKVSFCISAEVAQSIYRQNFDPIVTGSSPLCATIFLPVIFDFYHCLHNGRPGSVIIQQSTKV